jgi:hypothetical protein
MSDVKNTIKVRNQYGAGASVIFVMPPESFTKESVTELVTNAFPRGYPDNEKLKNLLDKRIKAITAEHVSALNHTPDIQKRLYYIRATVDPFLSEGDEKVRYDKAKKFLGFVTYTPTLPLRQLDKIALFLSLMQNVFDCFKPEYGWGCLYDEIYYQFKGNANKLIWGINYFGPKYVKEIGREKFDKLIDIYNIEERPWGGIIMQLAENPFLDVSNDKKNIIAEFLNIKEI